MKTLFYVALIFSLFLGSCSTRNSVSHNFSKRKYTKGHYKPERGHYNLAKTKESKSEEDQFAKQENQVQTKTQKKKEQEEQQVITQLSSNEIEATPTVYENQEKESILEDNPHHKLISFKEIEKEMEQVAEAHATPKDTPSDVAGLVLGLLSLFAGIAAVALASIGFIGVIYAWIGMALGGIAIILGSIGKVLGSRVAAGFGIALGVIAVITALVMVILFFAGVF